MSSAEEWDTWGEPKSSTLSTSYVRAAILGLYNITSIRRFYQNEGRMDGMRYLMSDDPMVDRFDRIHLLHPDDADYIAEALDWKPDLFS